MGFISKFILPKSVDFNRALQEQTNATLIIIEDTQKICIDNDAATLIAFSAHVDRVRNLKTKNMKVCVDGLWTAALCS